MRIYLQGVCVTVNAWIPNFKLSIIKNFVWFFAGFFPTEVFAIPNSKQKQMSNYLQGECASVGGPRTQLPAPEGQRLTQWWIRTRGTGPWAWPWPSWGTRRGDGTVGLSQVNQQNRKSSTNVSEMSFKKSPVQMWGLACIGQNGLDLGTVRTPQTVQTDLPPPDYSVGDVWW